MTTRESLLALATRTHPDAPWRIDDMHGIVYDERDGTQFDPANNSEQAMEVLCWLMARDSCNEVCHDTIVFYPRPGRFVTPEHIAHDNTPASLRAAIVQAACRVVSSAQPIAREIAMQQDAAKPFIRGKP